ncbi:MAG: hypothetical protein JSS14_15125 [Proteobacteria bacterium]|nr:hypothetical protein [Pseudomonadota bacterium]
MTRTILVVTAALATLVSTGLRAQGASGGRTASEVQAEAIAASHAPDQNGSVGTRGFGYTNFVSGADPEQVRQSAVQAANAPAATGADATGGIGSNFKSTRAPDSVAAEAQATAAAVDQNVPDGSKVNSKVISTMTAVPTVSAGK